MPFKNNKHQNGSHAPLLPGGSGLGPGRGASTLTRRFVCIIFFAVCLGVLLLHTVLVSDSQSLGQLPVLGRTIQSWSSEDADTNIANFAEEIQEVLAEQRRLIADEMMGYVYGRHSNNVSSLGDMVPEMGGTPIRSVVVTSWRSGSTFLGDVLNSHPGNWYHYEPLLDFDIVQVRGPPLADPAINNLKNLLTCNYTGMEHYLDYGKRNVFLFTHNRRLWQQCEAHPHLCWRPEFLNPMCRLFPAQSMKIVRLRLKIAEQLLQDPTLNVRMLLMVRDPRGTMQSRRHRDWCPNNPDCWDPALLCADLAADYYAAVQIARKYPQQFRVMRYEDLSVEPYRGVKELLSFFNLNFHPAVRLFLDTHTKADVGGVSSTFRDSKAAPFHWRRDLPHLDVQHIQTVCTEAMELWGYLPAHNATHQKDFNPLSSYRLK